MILVSTVINVFIAASIFFVWVIRYDNIIREFKEFGLPDGLRDITGIFKLSLALLLILDLRNPELQIFGAVGIAALMACAQAVHFRAGTALFRRLPSFALLGLSILSAYLAYGSFTS
jgi:hypothetical protein